MADKETGRVEAFSDGVFAIAITLLILEIKVPSFEQSPVNKDLFISLLNLWPSYGAFLMSFTGILIMWINHHGFFNYLRRIDSKFLFANGFLLLMVTFMPFPTAILARYIDSPAVNSASAFYCGSMVIVSLAYNILWFTSAYKRRLVKKELSDKLILKIRNAYLGGLLFYMLCFVISIYNGPVGLILNLSLWIFWAVLDYSRESRNLLRREHVVETVSSPDII